MIKAVLWLSCFNAWAKQHWLTVAMSNIPKHPWQAWPRFVLKSSSCLWGICVGEGCGNNCIASNWKMGERIFLQIPQKKWTKPTAGRKKTKNKSQQKSSLWAEPFCTFSCSSLGCSCANGGCQVFITKLLQCEIHCSGAVDWEHLAEFPMPRPRVKHRWVIFKWLTIKWFLAHLIPPHLSLLLNPSSLGTLGEAVKWIVPMNSHGPNASVCSLPGQNQVLAQSFPMHKDKPR